MTPSTSGTITVRYAGSLRHLGIGRAHRNTPIILLMNGPPTIIATGTPVRSSPIHHQPPTATTNLRNDKTLPKEGVIVVDVPRHL
jgi:hypothetical protein